MRVNLWHYVWRRYYSLTNILFTSTCGFKKIGGFGQFLSGSAANIEVSDFEVEKKYLTQKAETVASGLQGIGIRALQLNTQELIELFYGAYNPDQSTRQKLIDISQLESEIIEAQPEEMNI